MKRSVIGLGIAMASLNGFAAAPPSYTIVDLGANEQPLAVNGHADLAGYSLTFHPLPVIYSDGHWTTLPASGGIGKADAINDKGVAVGRDGFSEERWKNGHRSRIAKTDNGQATGIADDGTIVGYDIFGSAFGCWQWKDGTMTRLTGLGGGGDCFALDIDSSDSFIVGQSSTPTGESHAFLIDASGTHDLGTLNGAATSSAKAVNKHGHAAVVSQYGDSANTAAAYWNGKKLVDIGLHPNGGKSGTTAINDSDDVLAWGSDADGNTLFLYAGRTGIVTAIQPLISNLSGWTFGDDPTLTLAALGEDGTIYGSATFDGEEHAFELLPGTR